MLFEILSTASMVGIASSTYLFQNKKSNDHEKIKKIADECGLKTKEEDIRIYRKSQKDGYAEYIYKMPLGLSFKQFEEHKQRFIDGLNNKSQSDINLANFKKIDWKGNIWGQIRDIFNNQIKLDKHLEMEYDGMLRFRVYDRGLKEEYLLTKEIISKCKPWHVALGRTLNEQILHDFEKGPHILVGGATDMGKSTIINVIINSLLFNHPNEVEFTLIDLKGGLELGPYKNLKQVKRFAKDIDTAKDVLESVQQEMSKTFDMLERTEQKNIKDAGIKKRHFVIIDEAAELTSEKESDKEIKKTKIKCENFIKDIARRGRASGIRLLYSTQHPTTETIDSQVKRNLITRISLPVDTATASAVILDEGGAEKLPLIQGRSIYKKHRTQIMQAYNIDESLINEIKTPHINIRPKKEESNAKPKAREASFTFKAL